MIDKIREMLRRRKEKEYRDMANETFNVVRIDGVDVITFNNTQISRKTDTDILERLNELRNNYVKAHCRTE